MPWIRNTGKTIKKNLDLQFFFTFHDMLSIKTYVYGTVNVPYESNTQKTLKNTYFCWHLESRVTKRAKIVKTTFISSVLGLLYGFFYL
jgi:hypothetical protein